MAIPQPTVRLEFKIHIQLGDPDPHILALDRRPALSLTVKAQDASKEGTTPETSIKNMHPHKHMWQRVGRCLASSKFSIGRCLGIKVRRCLDMTRTCNACSHASHIQLRSPDRRGAKLLMLPTKARNYHVDQEGERTRLTEVKRLSESVANSAFPTVAGSSVCTLAAGERD